MFGLGSKYSEASLYTYTGYITICFCFFAIFKFAIPCVLKNIKNFFNYMKNYILSSKLENKSNLLNWKRQTGFISFRKNDRYVPTLFAISDANVYTTVIKRHSLTTVQETFSVHIHNYRFYY